MTHDTPAVQLPRWRRNVLVVAIVLFLANAAIGPYLAYGALRNTETTVNFIHEIQTSPASQTSRDASGWEIRQLQTICQAVISCRQVPLPPDVGRSLAAEEATTTTVPGQ